MDDVTKPGTPPHTTGRQSRTRRLTTQGRFAVFLVACAFLLPVLFGLRAMDAGVLVRHGEGASEILYGSHAFTYLVPRLLGAAAALVAGTLTLDWLLSRN
jgi:hypothetical protein